VAPPRRPILAATRWVTTRGRFSGRGPIRGIIRRIYNRRHGTPTPTPTPEPSPQPGPSLETWPDIHAPQVPADKICVLIENPATRNPLQNALSIWANRELNYANAKSAFRRLSAEDAQEDPATNLLIAAAKNAATPATPLPFFEIWKKKGDGTYERAARLPAPTDPKKIVSLLTEKSEPNT
jgi:hypothetical protein